ncbi:uncharacterized protein Bfra_010764 [Botrytis fragariae]|uniref:Uncharacterized protein n=1 Tax=Botrytis fragariae TaxID=1964551 RepID=A0A8H6ALQ7_9HELO|nr:uncharacterized protein Bfra_010764 [Botrytis fragariae]KAF5869570.1 hypothetical protein Bfra_010764 [Botrytis fragariae]
MNAILEHTRASIHSKHNNRKLVWKTRPITVDHIDLRQVPAFLMASKPDPLAGSCATNNFVRA